MRTNISVSKRLWDFGEKPICDYREKDAIRIIYWSMVSGTRIFSLESRDSGFYFVHKYREWIDPATGRGHHELHKQEVKLGEVEAANLFPLVGKADVEQDTNRVFMDGTHWQIETMQAGRYRYFEIDCRYTDDVTALGGELRGIFGLPFRIP
jgi:hypothetical protein